MIQAKLVYKFTIIFIFVTQKKETKMTKQEKRKASKKEKAEFPELFDDDRLLYKYQITNYYSIFINSLYFNN